MTARKVRRVVGRFGTHAALIVITLVWAVPVLALLISSFRSQQDILQTGWWTAIFPPLDFTLDNYLAVLSRTGIARSFLNSAAITIPVTVLTVALGSLGGYVFARWRVPGRDVAFVVVLALLSVPLQMTLVPVLRLFSSVEIVGTFPAIWIAHLGYSLPFSIYLMRNFFATLPDELFEAAFLEGASQLRAFFSIALPLAAPAVAAVAVFQFMYVWNDLLVALIFLGGGPDVAPLTVAVANLVNSRGEGWQVLTAAAFILMLVPIVVFFALQRYFVRGLLAGALK